MNNERLERLLWERLDGTIGDDDLAELEAVLAEHPDPQQLEREIIRLAENLDGLDRIPPPPELRNRIDRALSDAVSPQSTAQPTVLPATRPGMQHRWLPFAASLLIGVAIGYLVHPGGTASIDDTTVVGAIGTGSASTVTQSFESDLGRGLGTITGGIDGPELLIDAHLTGPTTAHIVVRALDGAVRILGTDQNGSPYSKFTVADEVAHYVAEGPGTHRFAVTADESTTMRIVVHIGDEMVADNSVNLEITGEDP